MCGISGLKLLQLMKHRSSEALPQRIPTLIDAR